jgi:hypothetical protein
VNYPRTPVCGIEIEEGIRAPVVLPMERGAAAKCGPRHQLHLGRPARNSRCGTVSGAYTEFLHFQFLIVRATPFRALTRAGGVLRQVSYQTLLVSPKHFAHRLACF